MKSNFLFLFSLSLILALFSCSKEEVIETQVANSTTQTSQNSNFRGGTFGPSGGGTTYKLMPYVEEAGPCYGLYTHSGKLYETVVYAQGTKPYDRRVTVFAWRNGNMSSIPNSYSVLVPAHGHASNRVPSFPNALSRYTHVFVEVTQVLKQNASGQWVDDTSAQTTTANIPVENCYTENAPCHWTNSCDDNDGDDDDSGIPSL